MFFKGKLSEFKFIRISFSPSNPSKVNQRGFVELKYEWQNFNDKLHKWRTRQVNGKKSGSGRFWCTVVKYEKAFLVGRWKNSGKIFQRFSKILHENIKNFVSFHHLRFWATFHKRFLSDESTSLTLWKILTGLHKELCNANQETHALLYESLSTCQEKTSTGTLNIQQ